jgi:hypothetical protein
MMKLLAAMRRELEDLRNAERLNAPSLWRRAQILTCTHAWHGNSTFRVLQKSVMV